MSLENLNEPEESKPNLDQHSKVLKNEDGKVLTVLKNIDLSGADLNFGYFKDSKL